MNTTFQHIKRPIAICLLNYRAFSFVVLFNRGRSLVVALSLSIALWPLKKYNYPLVALRVFCDVNAILYNLFVFKDVCANYFNSEGA